MNAVFLAAAELTRAGDRLAAPHQLTASRWLVLGALADGPLRVADWAAQLLDVVDRSDLAAAERTLHSLRSAIVADAG